MFEFRLGKGFGENICNIGIYIILHVDIAVLDGFADAVITDIDVFGPRVELAVHRERNRALVVAIERVHPRLVLFD